jgi:hypothetical protein
MFRNFIFTILMLISTGTYSAVINCSDTITGVISHSSGGVYFTTQNICSKHWCALGSDRWNTVDKLKNGLSVLLTANTTKKTVILEWDTTVVPDCSTVLDDYATPGFIMIK